MAHTRTPARSCVRFNGIMDLNRIPSSTHGHDFNTAQGRVVMVRKTEQRTFASGRTGEEPKFETVTRETVQTFTGNHTQKATSEKRDVFKGLPKDMAAALESSGMLRPHFQQAGPHTAGPHTAGPHAPGPHAPGPRIAALQAAGPHTAGPHTAGPFVAGPFAAGPHIAGPYVIGPYAAGPPTAGPHTAGPHTAGPHAAGPQAAAPQTASKHGPAKTPERHQQGAVPAKRGPTAKEESSDDYSNFAQDCLDAHNKYRATHGVPPLKLSKKICQFSEEWAKKLAASGKMEHRPNNDYGENLFCVWSSDPNHVVTGSEPVDNWYAEIKDHVFGREPRDLKSGHFTQVVWKDSRMLGVGLAKNRGGHTFVVANYDPPGNFIGNFATRVPPPRGGGGQAPQEPEAQEEHVAEPTDKEVQDEGLLIHNELRAKHGCPPLVLDQGLCKYAKEWATTLAQENKFQHRTDGQYGENIFCHWSSDEDTAAKVGSRPAVEAWYNEIKDFEFGVEPRSLKSGHFTQVIWKDSKKVGIGRMREGGRVIIVANYDPRGNYIGQFTANVPPPKKQ